MEMFTDNIKFRNGIKLDKNDLIQLEELINNIFSSDEEESLRNVNDFKYTIHYLIDGKKASFILKSIKELESEYENVELQELEIQKLIFKELNIRESIGFIFSRNSAYGQIKSDNLFSLKSKSFLLEDFFNKRQLKSGKINTWVSEKLHLYAGVATGIFMGIGIAFSLYYLVVVAGLLLILSGLISYPAIRNALFPKYHISLKESTNSERKKKLPSYINKAIFAIFCSLIASFIFYFISIIFLDR